MSVGRFVEGRVATKSDILGASHSLRELAVRVDDPDDRVKLLHVAERIDLAVIQSDGRGHVRFGRSVTESLEHIRFAAGTDDALAAVVGGRQLLSALPGDDDIDPKKRRER